MMMIKFSQRNSGHRTQSRQDHATNSFLNCRVETESAQMRVFRESPTSCLRMRAYASGPVFVAPQILTRRMTRRKNHFCIFLKSFVTVTDATNERTREWLRCNDFKAGILCI